MKKEPWKSDLVLSGEFNSKLKSLLNEYGMDNNSDTPDFILVRYLRDCLDVFIKTMSRRDTYHEPNAKEEVEVTDA